MSSEKLTQEQIAKAALAELISAVEPIIKDHIDAMDQATVSYIVKNYANYLKIDLQRDFEAARKAALTESPFDDLLNNG